MFHRKCLVKIKTGGGGRGFGMVDFNFNKITLFRTSEPSKFFRKKAAFLHLISGALSGVSP